MNRPDCVGEGAGWGTIEGVRLRVLVLADPAYPQAAAAIARALGIRHESAVLAGSGLFSALQAARAARELRPDLVHGVGVRGYAKSARTIAAGLGVPFVVSLSVSDLEGRTQRAAVERAHEASALLVDTGLAADRLREAGVARDIYVLAPPDSDANDAAFMNAIEVVYGRLMGANPELIADREEELVQIGIRRKGKATT